MAVDPGSSISGDPDEHLVRRTSTAPNNYGRFSSKPFDEMFHQQSREVDEAKRILLVQGLQKEVLGNVYWL